jgi:hypothetical protein
MRNSSLEAGLAGNKRQAAHTLAVLITVPAGVRTLPSAAIGKTPVYCHARIAKAEGRVRPRRSGAAHDSFANHWMWSSMARAK